jgi:hypothetical protein
VQEKTNAEYFNLDGSTNKFIDETRDTVVNEKGIKTGGLDGVAPTTFLDQLSNYRDNHWR